MRRSIPHLLAILLAFVTALAAAQQTQPQPDVRSRFFSPKQWETERAFERDLNALPDPKRLRAWHDMLASEPHVAGTEGDQRVIDSIVKSFSDMGLDVQVHEFWALLCDPIDAKLEIVSSHDMTLAAASSPPAPSNAPTQSDSTTAAKRRGVIPLPIREDNLLNDPYVVHPGLTFGWNAYSGSGDVTAGVVYANFGTKEDFETLKKDGIDCTGKIVIARYGGNFRGYKAKYAEAAGAAGLIIYTDPDDSGYRKGITYPEGGWANDTCIQRGSIITIDQPGDPLTPGMPATKDAQRIDPDKVDLPHIPVQPIGYRAAQAIMTQMTGEPLPEDLIKTWQGGLPCAYRLTGGEELKLHLMVKQERKIKRTANVIATLAGNGEPNRRVFIGSHHDAWAFGAGDPTSGTILVMEAARSFSEMAKRGMSPRRSISFCCWGAEEFGVIGSTEFCEQYGDQLHRDAIAYINLDAATMGPNFSAAADPLLKTLIEEVTHDVPQARDKEGKSVFEAWKASKSAPPIAPATPAPAPAPNATATAAESAPATSSAPQIGNLGGGSDHVGFYCYLGIPSCFVSAGGAPGTAYHSNYDNLAWYRHTVGDDYEPALMLTRVVNLMVSRLANAEIPPLDPARYAADLREHLKTIDERAKALKIPLDLQPLHQAVGRLDASATAAASALQWLMAHDGAAAATGRLTAAALLAADPWAGAWEPRWPDGIRGRQWFRNDYASSDADSGYAAWMLPALRGPLERGDAPAAAAAIDEYLGIIDHLSLQASALAQASGAPSSPAAATGDH